MKNILAFFVLVCLSFSCSSNDDNSDNSSLVGTWIITKQESNNFSVPTKLEPTLPCDEIGRLIFTNNKFQWIDKFKSAVNNTCVETLLNEEDYVLNETENKIIFSETYYLNIISKSNNTLVVETVGAVSGVTFHCSKM